MKFQELVVCHIKGHSFFILSPDLVMHPANTNKAVTRNLQTIYEDDHHPIPHYRPVLRVKKLSPYGLPPMRSTEGAAGYDLYSSHVDFLQPRSTTTISTDIAVEIPFGFYGQICDRSSLAKKGISVIGGVIDPDYRGAISVILRNNSDESCIIDKWDRIAQLILIKIAIPDVILVEDELTPTERGEKGFGSTGK